ncbi:MAG: hypothetical protein LBQ31_04230 [Bacteroidales bacterium]|jgi:hypothetical protein|nr:hypothetical protein [Bacteroidales bacterium]
MQLMVNLGYQQIINLIRQLPANQIEKIKQELAQDYVAEKTKVKKSEFQEFLLSGPVMSDKQYENFKENRKRFDKWRM